MKPPARRRTMTRRILLPGLLGGLVMVVWAFVVNGMLGFNASINMKPIPEERLVYEVLKQHVTEPGRYACNPAITESRVFPDGEPVFSVLNGGVGHEAAGALMLAQLPVFFILPILAVWMLSHSGIRILSSYGRKVLFFSAIGLLIGVSGHLTDFGIGSYPLQNAVVLTAHDTALWTVAGLVMAWRIRPVIA
jgi:hypothetical protein